MRHKPLLIYDGDCGFCKKWIARWKTYTKDAVDYAPYQEVSREFPQISIKKFQEAVQLIEPSGKTTEAAEAVFKTLAFGGNDFFMWAYQVIPGFRAVSEWVYRIIARHRPFFSYITNLFWGKEVNASTYRNATSIFIRFLGIIYLIAFVSLWVQIQGLIGSDGILPAKSFLAEVSGAQAGIKKFWLLPTIFWFNSSDLFLKLVCAFGVLFSLFIVIGILPSVSLVLSWFFYLSLTVVSRDFLSFQWDILLLEIGFLTIFLAPLNLRYRKTEERTSPRISRLLLKWLLFRLMFSSGMVKLLSHDSTWHDLTALIYHYETQPLPTWVGWFFHQFPISFQKFSCLMMFGIEIIVPFLIFFPRRLRHASSFAMIGLQILILITGNYCFFNLLTIALCILLFDDSIVAGPSKTGGAISGHGFSRRSSPRNDVIFWPKGVVWPIAVVIFFASLTPLEGRTIPGFRSPVMSKWLFGILYPFNIVNGYGLFARMTRERPEIIVEGSNDGNTWMAYEFKYKPGDLKRRPGFVEPHQPRLDWQMWFAALGSYESNAWFVNFCVRLLEGSRSVLKLIKTNPFPEKPPKFIRATVYLYEFTNLTEKNETGAWWKRAYQAAYIPVLALK